MWWFVVRTPGSRKEMELMNKIVQNGKEMKNVQQMLPAQSGSFGKRGPPVMLIGLEQWLLALRCDRVPFPSDSVPKTSF